MTLHRVVRDVRERRHVIGAATIKAARDTLRASPRASALLRSACASRRVIEEEMRPRETTCVPQAGYSTPAHERMSMEDCAGAVTRSVAEQVRRLDRGAPPPRCPRSPG